MDTSDSLKRTELSPSDFSQNREAESDINLRVTIRQSEIDKTLCLIKKYDLKLAKLREKLSFLKNADWLKYTEDPIKDINTTIPSIIDKPLETRIDKIDVFCNVCGKNFRSNKALSNHSIIHKNKTYRCTQCDKKFVRRGELSRHFLSHTGERNYFCHICAKSFVQSCHLTSHLTAVHNCGSQSQNDIKCEICGKTFNCQFKLKKHMVCHLERKFACERCPRKYPTEILLRYHTRHIHGSNSKQNLCPICGKSFNLMGSLKDHMNTHGERNFACDICDKKFRHLSNLKTHKISHTGLKNYVCTICDRAFTRPYGLRCHLKLHNEKNIHIPIKT